ncbi:hypothetical protein [Vibrio fluvialis]|uniref:hypothetical protein n=1 Tax=Vibrio fluvialis TaxID=676 RepID=UPI0024DF4C99|nr:hypothetical protein [Vibrio fluvialis]WIE05917.1 hypothetical protein QN061_18050 [Vibrio fluvialis]
MGGKSSSSNQTTNTTITENSQLSNAFNADMNGTLVSGIEGSTINVTDGGAVNAALKAMTDGSKNAIDAMLENTKYSTDLSKVLGVNALNNAQSATTDAMDIMKSLASQSDAGTAQEMTKYFMLAAVAVAVAFAVKGKF